MKIAVFSDVQGNLPAMETVLEHIQAWKPDRVIMNGDLVNRGPSSLDCLKLFDEMRRKYDWAPVSGNHEDYVTYCSQTPPHSPVDKDIRQFTDWTANQLGDKVSLMRDWPDHLCLQGPADDWMHVTHGSMAGNRIGISASIADEDLPERIPDDTDLFVVAHTHKALERTFRGLRIINVGSVGSPFDEDIRASYAQIEHRDGRWQTKIIRLDYDRDRAERDFHESGFFEGSGPLGRILFEEWRKATLMMRYFNRDYLQPVKDGAIPLERAVSEFLGRL